MKPPTSSPAKKWYCLIISPAIVIVLIPYLLIFLPVLFSLLFNLPPKFSVRLAGTNKEVDGSPIYTAFNVTLHAVNPGYTESCYRHGEAVVRYSGFTLAWGRTRAFCIDGWEAKDVPAVVRNDGVGLPRSLRERMAADRRRAGAVELEVDVRLSRGDDGSARPTWMSCKLTAAPQDFTPCPVFAWQNWASDIALY